MRQYLLTCPVCKHAYRVAVQELRAPQPGQKPLCPPCHALGLDVAMIIREYRSGPLGYSA